MTPTSLVVHHLGISQSERIVWLCEELELDYELRRYDRDPQTRLAPAAYRALHPFGTAPVIFDGEIVLGESGAIMEYILARYGNGRLTVSPEQEEFPAYLFWFHFANGSVTASAMLDLVAAIADPHGSVAALRGLRDRSVRAYALIEQRLAQSAYLAGPQFTAADIINFCALTTLRLFIPRDFSSSPHTRAYIKTIASRAAYRRAMNKSDPGFTPPLE